MKHLIIIVITLIYTGFTVIAQTENPDNKKLKGDERKALRKAKKEEEKRKMEEDLKDFQRLAEQQTWVVEAHTVFNKEGVSFQMDPTINFIGVKGDETTVQLSFNGIIGWNGVGGVTLEGKIGKYEYNSDNKSLTIKMTAMGASIGAVDIFLTVTGDGNGRATVSGNWGERITFQGNFVSLEKTRVYKGSVTY